MYQDEHIWLNSITSNLEGTAAGWLVSFHSEGVLEQQYLDAFMQSLLDRFKDITAAWHAETCIHSIQQDKQLVAEYIQDFCSLMVHLSVCWSTNSGSG